MAALLVCLLMAGPVAAQPDASAQLAAQREAMQSLVWMLGKWRGEAWLQTPAGRRTLVQTEHVTSMLEGTVLVAEGRAFEPDGKPTTMNAVGLYLYDPAKKTYGIQPSAIPGRFPLTVSPNGWMWSMPAGKATLNYVSGFDGVVWQETITQINPDGMATTVFGMRLRREP